jgi:hypothetical protein
MICIVCGRESGSSVMTGASVDDGLPYGTPHRWRSVGVTCEGQCENLFEADPYKYTEKQERKPMRSHRARRMEVGK